MQSMVLYGMLLQNRAAFQPFVNTYSVEFDVEEMSIDKDHTRQTSVQKFVPRGRQVMRLYRHCSTPRRRI